MPDVSVNESNHHQIDHGIKNENRADAETRNGTGNDWTCRAAEGAGSGEQGEACAPMLSRDDTMRGAQCKRQRSPCQQCQQHA